MSAGWEHSLRSACPVVSSGLVPSSLSLLSLFSLPLSDRVSLCVALAVYTGLELRDWPARHPSAGINGVAKSVRHHRPALFPFFITLGSSFWLGWINISHPWRVDVARVTAR